MPISAVTEAKLVRNHTIFYVLPNLSSSPEAQARGGYLAANDSYEFIAWFV